MKKILIKVLLLSSLISMSGCFSSNSTKTVDSTMVTTTSTTKIDDSSKIKKEDNKKTEETTTQKETVTTDIQTQPSDNQVNNQPLQQTSQQTVLITPTGQKYHSYKCGNGEYIQTTLEDAQNRGLTPCEKCYGGETTNPSEEVTPSSTKQAEPLPSSESSIETNSSSSEVSSNSTITVQSGEGPRQLAERAGITVDQLFELNGIDPNNYFLYPGQELIIK